MLCPAVDISYDEEIELPTEPQPAVSTAQLRSSAAAYLGNTSPYEEVVNALRADLNGRPPMVIQAATGDVLGKDAYRGRRCRRSPGWSAPTRTAGPSRYVANFRRGTLD